MAITWLHISDFHIRGGDPYDRDVVLRALVRSVQEFRERGRAPDLIFATGDVAHSGKPHEYELATAFFDSLLQATGLEKRHLFVIPGNHDVDRDRGVGLVRRLDSREEADRYFNPDVPKLHLTLKQGAFVGWHDRYFDGIRAWPQDSTCGPLEVANVRGVKIGVLPLNSALFCQGDDDHEKLWIGRRSLSSVLEKLHTLGADVNVALIHHPIDWLNSLERANIKAELHGSIDVILRGHLHETDVESIVSASGGALHVAAGAAYQTRRWPNRAMYATFDQGRVIVFPIRYEDQPREVWTIDPSLFPTERNYEKTFAVPGLAELAVEPRAHPPSPEPASLPRFRSNITSRRNLPFVGREQIIDAILAGLSDPSKENVLVLHGPPGAGKSEVAREFARRQRDRYPGGTFFIDGSAAVPIDLAGIGKNILGLGFPADLRLQDQCLQTLLTLGAAPALLIYDNVRSVESVLPWLPPAGMPCHVLITTVIERWDAGWPSLEVKPLSTGASVELIERIAGREIADRYGKHLAGLAGGLPVQISPAAATLAYEARRGRLDSARLTMTREARESFLGVYHHLEPAVRLLLHAAAFLNCQRLVRWELYGHVKEASGWSDAEFQRLLDACLDLHLLDDMGSDLRMHQLFATFVLATAVPDEVKGMVHQVRLAQRRRLTELANDLAAHPASAELAAAVMAFPLDPQVWEESRAEISIGDGEILGRALYDIGRFDEARPWFERAVEGKQQGDVHGRVDHASLGASLHQVGFCLSSTGKFDEARPWFERAVEGKQQGDVHGRVDHASLGMSLHQVGVCLSRTWKFDEARPWFERAIEAMRQGDVHGRVDYESLSASLHQVGFCLSGTGKFDEALPWFERAVEAAQQGDVHGRVDQASLGASLHQVGFCLSSTRKFDEARPWFERAVEGKQQGDVHGRFDHASLGMSLHQVGVCLSRTGKFDEARPWFERAVEAAQQGDVHGRVDHASLGVSLHEVGFCLSSTAKFDEARPWFERAVEAAQQGDVHGRINHASLSASLLIGAECLRRAGHIEQARAWEEQASKLKP